MNNQYAGMTVNERLYVSGLMEEFDKAVADKNVDKVILILKKVDLSDLSIDPILEQLNLIKGKIDE